MKIRLHKPSLPVLVSGTLAAAALTFSGASYACSAEPYLASVCIMAFAANSHLQSGFGSGMYLPANGQTVQISQNAALYSLLGTTYGGNGVSTFQLPDLRGRVVVGAGSGPGLPTYITGQHDGSTTATLTVLNLPPHAHGLATQTGGVTVTTTAGTLAATTTLTGLTATTSMSGVTGTVSGSGLTVNASSASGNSPSPSGRALATTGLTQIYTNATPNVAMSTGTIGGSASVAFSGNPTTTITGNPTTTLSGGPGVTVSGMTGSTGSGAAFNIMQPYLALQYFIAVQGNYPTGN
jgi:microcystin-dependent protein